MYKRNASKRNIDFLLTKAEFENLIKQDCTYCGTPAAPFNGIDRVRNWESYRTENVVPCCYICNRAKSTMPLDDFLNHIKKVFLHSVKR
jgi:5-methylcytosine-specific restriction endonuclease McrA